MKALIAAALALMSLLLLPFSGLLITVPLVTDDQLTLYQAVAKEQPVQVPWQALVALDAARYHQDFSTVSRASIEATARLFVACRKEIQRSAFNFALGSVGEAVRIQLAPKVPSHITWMVRAETGMVRVDLLDGLDRPVPGGEVEPGHYILLMYAEAAPVKYHIEVLVEAGEKTCYGRTMDEVMDDQRFSPFDREMAKSILSSFEEGGPVRWVPNPLSPYVWPVDGVITSRFGYRVSPTTGEWEFHSGVDIAAEAGTPVRVAAPGVVVEAQSHGNYGLLVRVRHQDFETWYGHLSKVEVRVGDQLDKGQVVGQVGNSGRSTGPHLHFWWRVSEHPVNPLLAYQ